MSIIMFILTALYLSFGYYAFSTRNNTTYTISHESAEKLSEETAKKVLELYPTYCNNETIKKVKSCSKNGVCQVVTNTKVIRFAYKPKIGETYCQTFYTLNR